MSDGTKIQWADASWNPISGCTKVSQGCKNCYAAELHDRRHRAYLQGAKLPVQYAKPFNQIQLHEDRLDMPLHWKNPRRIFVNSTSDLFHEDVHDGFIFGVFMRMAAASQHKFIILTKRADRMQRWIKDRWMTDFEGQYHPDLVLDNVWLGVSVEDQKAADERIPLLLQTPAAVRFVSCEPLLGPVDLGMNIATCDCCERWLSRWVRLNRTVISEAPYTSDVFAPAGIYKAESNKHGALSVKTPGGLLGIKPDEFECLPGLDWVIVGGESGPNARPMHPDWARSLRDQCIRANVPFFFKQWGEWKLIAENYEPGHQLYDRIGKKAAGRLLDGVEWNEYPEMRA